MSLYIIFDSRATPDDWSEASVLECFNEPDDERAMRHALKHWPDQRAMLFAETSRQGKEVVVDRFVGVVERTGKAKKNYHRSKQ